MARSMYEAANVRSGGHLIAFRPCLAMLAALASLLVISPLRAEMPPSMVELPAEKHDALFEVINGSAETATVDGQTVLRWMPEPGQPSVLRLRQDHPIFGTLRYYDRLRLAFRYAEGENTGLQLRARGHVSGVRQYKVHQFNLGLRTTAKNSWHVRDVELDRPFWFAWDQKDGHEPGQFLQFEVLGLVPGTVIELRDMRLVRNTLYVKPDEILPITWPRLERQDDGSAIYRLKVHVLNAGDKPTKVTPEVLTGHEQFDVKLVGEPREMKVGQREPFEFEATLSAKAMDSLPDLYNEPLRIGFVPESDPQAPAIYEAQLVKPLPEDLHRQVVVSQEAVKVIRDLLHGEDEEVAKAIARDLGWQKSKAKADEFLEVELVDMPRGYQHVRNGYPGDWRPGKRMPEIVNRKTGETEFGTVTAGQTWKEHFGGAGHLGEAMADAYLFTGDEKYAKKAIELLDFFADYYAQLPWYVMFDDKWFPGAPIQTSSRIASNSSYGTNMHFKWICRMASAVAESPSWDPETRQHVYDGFVLPYTTEMTKMVMPLSNMSDVTNHNLLLLGIAFDDATLVWHALETDKGLRLRLTDIDADGFSSEGRPLNYHFAGMTEYVASIGHLLNAGLSMDFPKERLLEAMRMPYRRATLWGAVPNTGDSGRYNWSVARNFVAGEVAGIFPDEHWLVQVGGTRSPDALVAARQQGAAFDRDAWREMISRDPELFKDAGFAVLRQGDTPEEQVMVTLDYGPSLFHGHLDRNQLTLSAFGLIYTHGTGSLYNVGSGGMTRNKDPKLEAFITGRSLANNVVMVDQQDQRRAIGKLLAWSDDPKRQVAVSKVEDAYPDVAHTRAVTLSHGVVVLIDKLESDTPRTFDFVYHNFGQLPVPDTMTATAIEKPLATTGNYENIVDLRRLTPKAGGKDDAGHPLALQWDLSNQTPEPKKDQEPMPAPGLDLRQFVTVGSDVQTYLGYTGMNNPNTRTVPDAAPSLLRRVQGKAATFVTVLAPFKGTSPVKRVMPAGDDGVVVELTDGRRVEVSLAQLLKGHPWSAEEAK